jgi:transglutaminase-like putative cysteine protease
MNANARERWTDGIRVFGTRTVQKFNHRLSGWTQMRRDEVIVRGGEEDEAPRILRIPRMGFGARSVGILPTVSIGHPVRLRSVTPGCIQCGVETADTMSARDRRQECRRSLWICVAWLLCGAVASASSFYDPSTFDKKWAYEYLETVEAATGQEAFDGIRYDNAMHLAMRLGPIDRFSMTPEVFVRHIRLTEAVENRFYQKQSLNDEEVKNYLLPLRIRYEHTSKPDWRAELSKEFAPLVTKAATTRDAATAVMGWIHKNLALTGSASTYRMPMRGDLDPLTVLGGKRGSEIDLTIFGVAALRTVGVAARLVWSPMMGGEIGGKCWLEYLNEEHEWMAWVPSIKEAGDHRASLVKQYGKKFVFILANPEAPVQITGTYVSTVEVRMSRELSDQKMSVLVLGKEGLVPGFGVEENEFDSASTFQMGRGPAFLAFSSAKLDRSLLRVVPSSDEAVLEIEFKDGKPTVRVERIPRPN